MRSVLTTAAEVFGIVLVATGVAALVGWPVPEVATISSGVALVVLGVSEAS